MITAVSDPYLAFVGFYDAWTEGLIGDVDFYVRRAQAVRGPIVELGVGTGRIAIPTAEAGQSVIGVDVSPAMLAEARRRAALAGVSGKIAFAEAQTIWQSDLPVLPPLLRPITTATSPRMLNFKPTPALRGETWNIEQWDLAPAP